MRNTDVLLLAAGFGKRLRPLTLTTPKPLVCVDGCSLIERHLRRLEKAGVSRVFVNAHHLASELREFSEKFSSPSLTIELVEEPVILDTGGAVKNIEDRLVHDTLMVINSDSLIGDDFSLQHVIDRHRAQEISVATLVLRSDVEAEQFGALGVDSKGRIVTFLGEEFSLGVSVEKLMFLGVSVWNRECITAMPSRGSVFSLTRDVLVDLLKKREHVGSFQYNGYWTDVGTLERLSEARSHFSNKH